MFSSNDQLLNNVKIDFKRIELFRRAAFDKNLRISSNLLRKLDDCCSVDELFSVQSTSSAPNETRRTSKRKLEEDLNMPNSERCTKCDCRMLRSVDTGRPDKQNVLECMRASCLASVKLTDKPAGTVVGREFSTHQKSVYNSMARYYPNSLHPSTPADDEDLDEQEQRGRREKPVFSLGAGRSIFVDVPGQEKSARLH